MKNEKKVIFEKLSDAEVGQLYRAKLSGQTIQSINNIGAWSLRSHEGADFSQIVIYRVKPEPEPEYMTCVSAGSIYSSRAAYLPSTTVSFTKYVEIKALEDLLQAVKSKCIWSGKDEALICKLSELVKGGDV